MLKLVVTGVSQLTPRIRTYQLRAPDWSDLPTVSAGAHLTVPVKLPEGALTTRQYSLSNHPRRRDIYEIAVLCEENGRGGSAAIHNTWQIGTRLALASPSNQFPLHEDTRPTVLIAGGIGITPIKSMAHELKTRGVIFVLHYSCKTAQDMVYRDQLALEFDKHLYLYFTSHTAGSRIPLRSIMSSASNDTLFYVCGPVSLIKAALTTARELKVLATRIQFESFE